MNQAHWAMWLTWIACLAPFGLNVLIPIQPAIADDLARDGTFASAVIGFYTVGMAGGQLAVGWAADRIGRRPVLLAGLALTAAAGLAVAAATTGSALLAARLLQGIGAGTSLVIPRAVVRDVYPAARVPAGMATVSLAFALTPAVAPVLGSWVGGTWGWRTAAALMPLLALTMFMLAWPLHRETGRLRTAAGPSLRVLLQDPVAVSLSLGFACISGCFFALISEGARVAADVTALSPMALGWLFGTTYLGFLVGSLAAGRFARRFGPARLALAGACVATLGLALLAFDYAGIAHWAVALTLYSIGHGIVFPNALAALVVRGRDAAANAAAFAGTAQMTVGALLAWLAAAPWIDPSVRLQVVCIGSACAGTAALAHASIKIGRNKE